MPRPLAQAQAQSGKGRPAVFLDRDGVINRASVRQGKAYAPRTVARFRLLPGVVGAARALHDAGWMLVVVTNQPDIGNGLVEGDVVEAMHQRLLRRLPIDAIEMCPHRQDAGCRCRKPRPGMLLRAAKRLGIALGRSVMIGDRPSDVAAGRAAGCRTIFIDLGYSEPLTLRPDAVAANFPEAASLVLAGNFPFGAMVEKARIGPTGQRALDPSGKAKGRGGRRASPSGGSSHLRE